MRPRTVLLWVFLACVAIAAGIGVWGLLGGRGILFERTLLTSLIFGVACLPSMALALVHERRGARWLTWLGFAATALAATLWLLITWDVVRYTMAGSNTPFEWTLKAASTSTTLSVWATLCAPVLLVSFERWLGKAARIAALVCVSMAAATIVFAIYFEETVRLIGETYGRALGVFAILGLASTFSIPALRRLEHSSRDDHAEHTIGRRPSVRVRCPRCDAEQTIRAGAPSACASCGLRIRVDVEEPRCQCGYLLYGVTGNTCPECGAEVRRWATESSEADDTNARGQPPAS